MDANVLFVEDDRSIREVTTLELQQAGFRVTACGDGREGLDVFAEERFDLVLLDVMLPGVDGFEVCREIRRSHRTPIIMLTARTDTIDVVVGLELGADDYVSKPFRRPSWWLGCARCCDGPRPRRRMRYGVWVRSRSTSRRFVPRSGAAS